MPYIHCCVLLKINKMKHAYFFLATSVILAVCSFYLVLNGVDEWGWFLFGAIVTFVYPSKSGDEDD